MALLLMDVVEMVPGLVHRLIPSARMLCLIQTCMRLRDLMGSEMLDGECSWEMFLRLKPSLTAQDAKHMKFWRFKACAMHLRVPVSSMMEPLHAAFKDSFKRGWQGPVDLRVAYSWCGPPGAKLLAGVLPQCRVLRVLDCEKCILGSEGSELLAPGLGTCSTLEMLSTAECLIRSDGVLKLAPALQSCHALTSLDMSKNQIGALGVDTLTRCLQQCPSLAHLKLSSNQLGEDGCNNIARNLQLPYYTALVGLDISLNDVGDRGAMRVGFALDALASAHSGLIQLNLANNQLSAAVSGVVLSSARFSVLRMCSNHLLPHFTLEMREGLERSVGLKELSLSACSMQGHLPQFASVLRAMGACPHLEVLDLSCNHAISDEGVEALAAGLERSRELRIMSLECCGIGDRGALALALGMAGWVRLESLILKNNGISDIGAEAMASLLRPRSARHSRRGKEHDTDQAKDKQREAERGNGAPTRAPGRRPSHHVQGLQLRHLDLEANHVQDDGALAFAAALLHDKTLVRLVNLSRNFISCKCVQGLQDRFVEAAYGGQTDDGDMTHDIHVHLQERAQQTKEQQELEGRVEAIILAASTATAKKDKTLPRNPHARKVGAGRLVAPIRIPFPAIRTIRPETDSRHPRTSHTSVSRGFSPSSAASVAHGRAHGRARAMESCRGGTDLSEVSEVGVGARAARDVTQELVTHEHVRQVGAESRADKADKEGKDSISAPLLISAPHVRMTLMDLKCQRGRGRNAPHVLLRII